MSTNLFILLISFKGSLSNFKKDIKRYSRGFRKRLIGLKFGDTWQDKGEEFYDELWEETPLVHKDFVKYLNNKNDIQTVLEVGCGAGVYPLKYKKLFDGKDYSGIDISKSAIEHCKTKSNFDFQSGDFIKMNIKNKYDLVFSHSVVDHVYDIDTFISKIVNASKKYAYIFAYRGYFPELVDHNMKYAKHQGCYHNEVSVKKVKEIFSKLGISRDEYSIEERETGYPDSPEGTLILITKKI